MTQISTKFRMTTLAVLFAFCTMMMASTGAMAAPTHAAGQNSTLLTSNVAGGVLNGVVSITHFVNQNGQLVAQGTFNGTFTNAAGVVTSVSQAITAPVTNLTATCPILSLTIGPINLDILGLVITVPNPIVVNITAVPGAGNLLGNLLCAVANLLNGGSLTGILDTLVADLNSILAALAGL
jgi:hypothetical protein